MAKDIKKVCQNLITKGLKIGADNLEIFYLNAQDLDIQVSNQSIENIKLAEERGIGIRAYKNNSMGFAFTTDLDETALDKILNQAITNTNYTSSDQYNILPGKFTEYPKIEVFDEEINKTSMDAKIAFAKEIEQYAKAYDKRVKMVQRAGYVDAQYENLIINSHGLEAYYQGAYCGGYCLAIGEEKGDNQTGFGMQYSLKYQELNPQEIGEKAGERAVRLLGASSVNSQQAPIVLEPYIAANFLGIIASALSGDAVQKGKSFLADKMDQRVASELVTIIDDGQLEGGILSAPFDGEGVPTSKKLLLEKGILKQFLQNTYTAAKANTQSTGNGTRGSYRGTPEVGTTNFYFAPGTLSPVEIIKNIEQGLYVTDVMGLHTANPISGDFSLGASGIWIEKGVLTKPVRGIAIAGNLRDILLNIDGVANDLTFFVGKGSPTIKINNISISGGSNN